MRLYINGDICTLAPNNITHLHGNVAEVTLGRQSYVIAEDAEAAGEAAKDYYENLAENGPEEFACLVGVETLIQWALGRSAGPGSNSYASLTEWLDAWAEDPADHFGQETEDVHASRSLQDELGWKPTVAYRG